MRCSRCAGLMVEDHSIELDVLEDEKEIVAWRCVNCGHIIEPVMLRNRFAYMTHDGSLVAVRAGDVTH